MVKSGSSEQIGARRVAERRGGPPWWTVLLALIVLLLLAGAAWLLFFDDDSDVEIVDEATTPTTATPPSTSPPTTDANAAVGAGEIFAGGQRVLPGGESQLTRFVDQPASGRTVRVLSVPSDESFWVRHRDGQPGLRAPGADAGRVAVQRPARRDGDVQRDREGSSA
jgi:hypothetical protein